MSNKSAKMNYIFKTVIKFLPSLFYACDKLVASVLFYEGQVVSFSGSNNNSYTASMLNKVE